MKTIELKLYSFNELSDEAKGQAIERYRNNIHDYAWTGENKDTLEKFAEIFPIKITDWSYGGRGEGVSFYFTESDEIENMSGLRLAKYLWNNYKTDIFKPKWRDMGKLGLTDNPIRHKRVKSKQITNNCPNKGKYSNSYYSAIFTDTWCQLTGYYMDNEILDEIYKYIDKPDSRTFRDLLEDCFDNWVKACNADIEYQNSDEYISEHLEVNEYEFTENGEIY